jgi:U3 small nucleolar RNA-associated protein 3
LRLQQNSDPWQQPGEPSQKPTQVENPSDRISVLQHLQKTNPEALALALEWDDVVHSIVKTEQKIAK